MIRGYVAVVSSGLPLSQVPPITPDSCRKATIRFLHNEDTREFYISVEDADYSFKVVGNVQTVDKRNIANGCVRIGFIEPNLDIVISCNPGDLKTFVYTMEVVKDVKVLPPTCSNISHKRKLKCVCHGRNFSQYRRYHTTRYDCPLSAIHEELCAFCCYRVLKNYNGDDARTIMNTLWKSRIKIQDDQLGFHIISGITVTSYPYLRTINICGNDLVEIPEALGFLPCLTVLNLCENRLRRATNWNWLISPFIRENLRTLWFDHNGLSSFPEPILGLRNLETLTLLANCLTELPAALGNLKHLSCIDIANNKLEMLPAWMYRKERYSELYIDGNDFPDSTEYHKPNLSPKDFETVAVPSLFEIAAKYIITERLAFWENNIPARLVAYLEGAYYCRCGSVVFPHKIGRVIQCQVRAKALAEYCDVYDEDNIVDGDVDFDYVGPIAIHCCSYECYKLIEPYMRL